MTVSKLTGKEPAFPTEVEHNSETGIAIISHGISLHQYFAAMAMQGYISNGIHGVECVNHAIKKADEMIAALNWKEEYDQSRIKNTK